MMQTLLIGSVLTALSHLHLAPPDTRHTAQVTRVVYTRNGSECLSFDRDGTVIRWAEPGRVARQKITMGPYPTHRDARMALAPGGESLAIGYSNGPAQLFSTRTRTLLREFPQPLPDADTWYPVYSADGQRLAFGYYRGHGSPIEGPTRVPIWDLRKQKPVGTVEIPLPPGGIVTTDLYLSQDGARLASVTRPAATEAGQQAVELGIWDVATGERLAEHILPIGLHAMVNLLFLPQQQEVLIAHSSGIALWNYHLGTWREPPASNWNAFGRPVLAPDGRSFMILDGKGGTGLGWPMYSTKERYVWYETATLMPRWVVPVTSRSAALSGWWAVAFHPSGREIALGRGNEVRTLSLVPAGMPEQHPDQLWKQLASTPTRACRALQTLVSHPTIAEELFRKRLRPVTAPETRPEQVDRWIQDLDANLFVVRDQASRALGKHARVYRARLETALQESHSAEQRERLTRLIDQSQRLSPDDLRGIRSVEVLEMLGTPAAWECIQEMATGAPDAPLTQHAQQTLERKKR